MTLIRWRPVRDIVSPVFDPDRFFNDFGLEKWHSDTHWNPSVDLSETENDYKVRAELPGLSKDDIKISYKDSMLLISGEKKHKKEDKESNYHRIERRYGKFQRAFRMDDVKANDIKAEYKDGVLTIDVPKSEKAKPKQIAVK